ncbi:TerB-C domain-containing protein [Flavobacterium segetis]|uniref:TerB-C domain-containing protein n=1 Tax=Flavobacterium segetis TaxID=271157 RepID=A0A1M5I656_9FLAO|nr:tellurite resistance TerB C-terminal domain-containing protein [Flavobacterium segetis]SHG23672.1 TerB-C domain-containing protein [Flavobacterium segetis]
MTALIIIGVIILIIIVVKGNKKPTRQEAIYTNLKIRQKSEKEIHDELVQNLVKNIKIAVTTSNGTSSYNDDSIIDVTDQTYNINSNNHLKKYSSGVPYWSHRYVYSYSELNSTSDEQEKFYCIFKINFLNGTYFDLEGNMNYAFILLFDLLNEYDDHKSISKLESQLKILGEFYPKTKSYCISFLIDKMELGGYSDDVLRLRTEDRFSYQNYNSDYDYDYWRLGSKYKSKLNLSEEQVILLNKINYPSNNFCSIEFCCLEVLKLYVDVIQELKSKYKSDGTTIEKEFLFIADVIARKHFRYRNGSQNYKYCIESTTNEFYSIIFKYCENAVREFYGHKRKLNTDIYHTNEEAKTEVESKITLKVSELLSTLISKIIHPDEATEIELNSQTTSRWKLKFEELTTNYKINPKEFVESIIELGKLNKKNPSIENIFFEASKFIAKHDKVSSLTLYIHYLHHDIKSVTFDNKQLTKTIQKGLFKTNEQIQDFEQIVNEFISDKNLDKALKAVVKVYEVKRKKIQLDRTTIKEVQAQHSGTVELLNEYLRDDFEDENDTIQNQEINSEEIMIEIIQKNDESHQSPFLPKLSLNQIQISILELFYKNNFSILQSEIEEFAKSKGVFKNQVIESVNETCYEVLDDVLIEEEDDYYSIIPEYFQKISTK